jgi:hypothetical protein
VSVPVALEIVAAGSETHLVPVYSDRALCGALIDPDDLSGSSLTCRHCAGRLPEEATS